MYKRLVQLLMDKFGNEDSRSLLVKKNILATGVAKGIALLTSFLVVPLTLDYLEQETFGIWLTISNILYWITFFNFGLSNGMRNYLSISYSKQDFSSARSYVSTTLVMLTIIALVLALIVFVLVPNISLQQLLNTRSVSEDLLRVSLLLAMVMTLVLFVVKTIGTIYCAIQLPAVNDALSTLGSVMSLAIVYCLVYYTEGSLVSVVAAYTIPPVLVFVIAAVPTFIRYKEIRPSFKCIDWSLWRQIVGKGLGFFAIQITSCLVIYGSSNIFISHYCGPSEVSNYGIAYKFLNLLFVVYSIFLTPYWNAYTDAYVKGNLNWIQESFRKTLRMWGVLSLVGLGMVLIAPLFYRIWVKDSVQIPWTLTLVTWLYITMLNLNTCVTYLTNGLNKIRIQIITSILFTALYVISVACLKDNSGATGIVALMAISYFLMAAIHYYQCRLIISGRATGIWNK